ncbi:hypothetical protein [Glycomyces xiaoerkulensis]|uniref:hypothetical protein n=1 Tax=Glycomyces xiaoerkulensis TaxID=2038139 RepID=UPI000C25674C|nr:hypothetical protein [Glycomyces xiaoerkulensis]
MPPSELDTGPDQPRAVRTARLGLWLQFAYFVCGGMLPVLFLFPAFGLVMLGAASAWAGDAAPMLALLVLLPALGVATALLSRRLGERSERARTCTDGFALVLAVGAALASLASPVPFLTLATAVPWFGLQIMTVASLHSAPANRWFGDAEP